MGEICQLLHSKNIILECDCIAYKVHIHMILKYDCIAYKVHIAVVYSRIISFSLLSYFGTPHPHELVYSQHDMVTRRRQSHLQCRLGKAGTRNSHRQGHRLSASLNCVVVQETG